MDLIDETFQLDVNEKYLEIFATGTLIGTIAKKHKFGVPKQVVLVFPRASLDWCRRHAGPPQWIVNEFVLMCFVEDVLTLREWGVDVQIQTVARDPS